MSPDWIPRLSSRSHMHSMQSMPLETQGSHGKISRCSLRGTKMPSWGILDRCQKSQAPEPTLRLVHQEVRRLEVFNYSQVLFKSVVGLLIRQGALKRITVWIAGCHSLPASGTFAKHPGLWMRRSPLFSRGQHHSQSLRGLYSLAIWSAVHSGIILQTENYFGDPALCSWGGKCAKKVCYCISAL